MPPGQAGIGLHELLEDGFAFFLRDANAGVFHLQAKKCLRRAVGARLRVNHACYTCHTDYVPCGALTTKLRGLRHVYAQYLGTPSKPIRLYRPYNNRECLHCHAGARSFEQGATHNADPETLPAMKANKLSCLSSGCHAIVHNVASLKDVRFWQETR